MKISLLMPMEEKKKKKRMGPNLLNKRIQPVIPWLVRMQVVKKTILAASGIRILDPETMTKTKFDLKAVRPLPHRETTVMAKLWMLCYDFAMKWLLKTSKADDQAQHCSSTLVPSGDSQGRKGTNTCDPPVFLEAVLPRRAHAHAGFATRPRYGQLAALNAVRVSQMCNGTTSPLGEFLSLLAYGKTLQRNEGPAYHFYWSEDGQTISWDGNARLSMGQFRCLAHEAFRQATAQSQRLMYGFDPEDPKMGSLRDRLSKTTPGYSFLTDTQKRLEELYLTVFLRACTAPIDGLLKTQHRDSQSSWDVGAAQTYLHGHDTFLKTLMVLGQLDSGQ
ncbi:hypothetical protein FOMA001_g19510 [Fusarium oxysporum f. sp. matthiolae]|nr:hypothetical protein FOMA001_g19510 [Fusarium oxysporum f. sp. matthiolae]